MAARPNRSGTGNASTGRLLTETEAAERLGFSPRTLQQRRSAGAGPKYVKLGPGKNAPVRYPEKWIDEEIAAGERSSTSQPAAA